MAVGIFTDLKSVKTVARLTNEVPDEDINEFIDGINQEILREHGYPTARIYSYVDSDRGSYFLNEVREPAYKIDRVWVGGSLLNEGSWTDSAGSGFVSIPSSLSTGADGSIIQIDYIPKIYHQLATFMVAKDLIESQYLVSSEGGMFPRTSWLNGKIKNILNSLPSVMYRSSNFSSWDPVLGVFVDQTGLGEEIN